MRKYAQCHLEAAEKMRVCKPGCVLKLKVSSRTHNLIFLVAFFSFSQNTFQHLQTVPARFENGQVEGRLRSEFVVL